MRWTLAPILFAILFWPAAAAFECPKGAYPWFTRSGVLYCKRDIIGPEGARSASVESCPAGTKLTTDRWGWQSCEKPKGRSR